MFDINTNTKLKHYGFPEIKQLAEVIVSVNRYATYVDNDINGDPIYNPELPKPTLKFVGTTKLHGTNSGIVIDFHNEVIYYESRYRIGTFRKRLRVIDNSGFASYMSSIQNDVIEMVKSIIGIDVVNAIDWSDKVFVLFGEWCGKGVQGGVALNQLDKMYVVFNGAIRPRENIESRNIAWLNFDEIKRFKIPSKNVLNIYDFKTWEIEIDFNKHHEKASILSELVKQVEDECPVAKQLGISGIGEGIVWRCVTEPYDTSDFWFKSKGDKHAKKKEKVVIPVDNEKVAKLMEVADKITPSWRLEQMFNETFKPQNGGVISRGKLGDYIKSVNADIDKEEKTTLEESGVTFKEVANYVSKITRDYFFMMEKDFLENPVN